MVKIVYRIIFLTVFGKNNSIETRTGLSIEQSILPKGLSRDILTQVPPVVGMFYIKIRITLKNVHDMLSFEPVKRLNAHSNDIGTRFFHLLYCKVHYRFSRQRLIGQNVLQRFWPIEDHNFMIWIRKYNSEMISFGPKLCDVFFGESLCPILYHFIVLYYVSHQKSIVHI